MFSTRAALEKFEPRFLSKNEHQSFFKTSETPLNVRNFRHLKQIIFSE